MTMPEWTTEWPTEPGWYWFYGRLSAIATRMDASPRLYSVLVRKGSNHFAYIAEGSFVYQEEGAVGKWIAADVPEIPGE